MVSAKRIAQAILGLSAVYLLYFALRLFPYRAEYQALELTWLLPSWLPGRVLRMLEYWPVTTFYLFADLWVVLAIATAFWGLINRNTTMIGAQRWYGWFLVGGTTAPYIGAWLSNVLICKYYNPLLWYGHDAWTQTLFQQLALVAGMAVVASLLVGRLFPDQGPEGDGSQQRRIRFWPAMCNTMRSPYLRALAVCVVGYAWVYLMSDLVWKSELKQAYPDPNMLMRVMNQAQQITGVCAVTCALLTPFLTRRFGWRLLAMATPVVLLVTTAGLFAAVLWGEWLASWLPEHWGWTAVSMVTLSGAIQNGLGKAMKFSLFDASKEMAMTALEQQDRWDGKLAIDAIGTYAGKTGTAAVQSCCLFYLGNATLTHSLFGISVVAMLLWWMASVLRLNVDYGHRYKEAQAISRPQTRAPVAAEQT